MRNLKACLFLFLHFSKKKKKKKKMEGSRFGKVLTRLQDAHQDSIWSVKIRNDMLVTGSVDQQVKLWLVSK